MNLGLSEEGIQMQNCLVRFRNVSGATRHFYYYQATPGTVTDFYKVCTYLGAMPPNSIATWFIETGKILQVRVFSVSNPANGNAITFTADLTNPTNCNGSFDMGG